MQFPREPDSSKASQWVTVSLFYSSETCVLHIYWKMLISIYSQILAFLFFLFFLLFKKMNLKNKILKNRISQSIYTWSTSAHMSLFYVGKSVGCSYTHNIIGLLKAVSSFWVSGKNAGLASTKLWNLFCVTGRNLVGVEIQKKRKKKKRGGGGDVNLCIWIRAASIPWYQLCPRSPWITNHLGECFGELPLCAFPGFFYSFLGVH